MFEPIRSYYRVHPKTYFHSQLSELFLIAFTISSLIGHSNVAIEEASFEIGSYINLRSFKQDRTKSNEPSKAIFRILDFIESKFFPLPAFIFLVSYVIFENIPTNKVKGIVLEGSQIKYSRTLYVRNKNEFIQNLSYKSQMTIFN